MEFIYDKIPEEEIYNRINKLKIKLNELDLPIAIIYYPVNSYYFSGCMQDQILLVFPDKDPILFVKRCYERARNDSSIKDIIKYNSLKELKSYINEKKVGIEFENITFSDFLKFKEIFEIEIPVNISPIIGDLRAIKSEFEISIMQKAGEIGNKVYTEAANYLKEGITEIEFAGIMEMLARKYGHEGILRTGSFRFESYTSHIMSGITGSFQTKTDTPTGGFGLSPAFPCGASTKKIKKGEPILVDFGICIMGYQIDETRMFIIGEPDDWIIDAFDAVKLIEDEIFKNIKPNISGKNLFDIALKKAEDIGYSKYFLGYSEKHNFIGHGIGLHTSEKPIIAKNFDIELKENMTIAFEPKMVFPDKGGIGIEDTIVIKKEGIKRLTPLKREIFTIN